MADALVEITSGTGTNIDTRTEATNGHHRQVIIIGDPSTNAGVAPVDATAGLKVDLGADNDITGTVTANLSATDNAVLDSIDSKLTDVATQTTLAAIKAKTDNIPTLGQALAAASVPVILPSATITTLTPPAAITGFATSAKQDTGNTSLGTIAGAVSGTEMQVDVLTMPTVTVNSHAVTNAGTFATQIDGSALTSLQLVDDVVATLGTTTYTEATTKGTTIGAVRRDADTTLVDTTNEIGPLQMDANGRLKVEAFSGETLPVSLTSTTVTGTVAVTQSGTWDEVGINDSGNSITVDYATTGSGTATGALRVELPTNGTGVIATVSAVTAITNALPAGTNAIGKLAANSGVDIGDVDVTSISAGTNNIGQVSVAPQTANGLSVFNGTSSDGGTALTSTAQVIKASAGQVYGWYIYNPNATAQFVQFYNTAAASVTVGTTNPLFMLTIPATAGANVEFTNGITFSNAGFSCAATSTAGGNGAPTTALDAVIFFK